MIDFEIVTARCQGLENPLGIDRTPYFSWRMASTLPSDYQTEYRVTVRLKKQPLEDAVVDVWDSGWIISNTNTNVLLPSPCKPSTMYWWQVSAKNASGQVATSQPQYFSTGLLGQPWSARWISPAYVNKEESAYGAPYLHKKVALKEMPVSAMLHICGLGYYEAYIEGENVTDSFLNPAFTRFDKTVKYNTFDVLNKIRSKQFALGVVLGNGWYNGFSEDTWRSRESTWRANPKLIAELHLEYANGTKEIIITNSSWKALPSPITMNAIRNGEFYDARLETPNWNRFSCDITNWQDTKVVRSPGGVMEGLEMPLVQITQELAVKKYWKNHDGTWVFDLGQNFAGIVAFQAVGKLGQEFTLKYGELLTKDGTHVDQTNIASFIRWGEVQTDHYIKGSDHTEVWSPRFSYYGFQYVQITGLVEAQADTIKGLVLHTAFRRHGHFTSSNQVLNQIDHMCRWSLISNFHSTPTDCPHREKNSWTGDAAIAVEQAILNFDGATAWEKWFDDLLDSQRPNGSIPCVAPSTSWGYNWGNGPDWSNALTIIPWILYLHTGNQHILEKAYPAIVKHFRFMESMMEDGVVNYGIGDWCAPFEGPALSVNMSTFKAPTEYTDNVYVYKSACILAQIETVLGYPDTFSAVAAKVRDDVRRHYIKTDPVGVFGDCQTSDGTALYHGLLTPDEDEIVLASLVKRFEENNWHLDYGLIGSKFIPRTLAAHGRMDVVYNMLMSEGNPGYRHWIELGLTTCGEIWSGLGSRNHYMFSDISAVFYQHIAGIQPDPTHAGYRKFFVKPNLMTSIPSVSCDLQSPHGEIKVGWHTGKDGITLTVQVPFGTSAQLALPAEVTSVSSIPKELQSGVHTFLLLPSK